MLVEDVKFALVLGIHSRNEAGSTEPGWFEGSLRLGRCNPGGRGGDLLPSAFPGTAPSPSKMCVLRGR